MLKRDFDEASLYASALVEGLWIYVGHAMQSNIRFPSYMRSHRGSSRECFISLKISQPAKERLKMAQERVPKVLHPISLPDFLPYILDRQSHPTHLIICSSRDDFVHNLLASVAPTSEGLNQEQVEETPAESESTERVVGLAEHSLHRLLIPTIRLISQSLKIKVTFCPSLKVLQAHLATYPTSHIPPQADQSVEVNASPVATVPATMALLNPIAVHRETTAFSAQGISKTIAAAVDAAARCERQLVIAECSTGHPPSPRDRGGEAQRSEYGEGTSSLQHVAMGPEHAWEEEIPILNVTTKSFGTVGKDWWVGRTVKIRSVAERWCRFECPGS